MSATIPIHPEAPPELPRPYGDCALPAGAASPVEAVDDDGDEADDEDEDDEDGGLDIETTPELDDEEFDEDDFDDDFDDDFEEELDENEFLEFEDDGLTTDHTQGDEKGDDDGDD